jgi:hypothetical protein
MKRKKNKKNKISRKPGKTYKKPTMKRKRTKKTRSRRRGRVSGSNDLVNLLSITGGAVAAGFLNKVIPPTVNDKISAGGKIALGFFLPKLIKGKGGDAVKHIGYGMIAIGAVDLLKSFGVLNGDFDIPVINADVLSEDELEQLNGLGEEVLAEDIPVINGQEEED